MANNKLTLLACSGSILASTLFGMPSQGMPLSSFGDGSQRIERVDSESTQSEEITTPANYQQRLKRAAVEKFGCSCTNCISSIRQLVRSGTLSV